VNGPDIRSIMGCVALLVSLLLHACATGGDVPAVDGTLFPEYGTKGKAVLLQQPHDLYKNGFRDGKVALVNIIDISSEFGISEIKYGMVALAHPVGTPLLNSDVGTHVHVGDFKPALGSIPVDPSGWPHYVRVQNFSDDPTDLLDVVIACEPKADPKARFDDVSKMAVSFGNPYTCNLNPNEVYGTVWGTTVHEYGALTNDEGADDLMPVKFQELRKIMANFNATVIDEVKRQASR